MRGDEVLAHFRLDGRRGLVTGAGRRQSVFECTRSADETGRACHQITERAPGATMSERTNP